MINKAIEYYGLTDDWNKAGYLLPDGSMLDFSEATPQRTLDHRDISIIIDTKLDESWQYINEFMSQTGAIRIIPEFPGIDLMQTATYEQLNEIRKMVSQCMAISQKFVLIITEDRIDSSGEETWFENESINYIMNKIMEV